MIATRLFTAPLNNTKNQNRIGLGPGGTGFHKSKSANVKGAMPVRERGTAA